MSPEDHNTATPASSLGQAEAQNCLWEGEISSVGGGEPPQAGTEMVPCQRKVGPELCAPQCRRAQFPGSRLPPNRGLSSRSSALCKGGRPTSEALGMLGPLRLGSAKRCGVRSLRKRTVPLLPFSLLSVPASIYSIVLRRWLTGTRSKGRKVGE